MENLTEKGFISQRVIQSLLEKKVKFDNLKEEIKKLESTKDEIESELNSIESQIISLLEEGYKVSPGKYRLEIELVEKKPRISWKSVVEDLMGKEYIKKLMDSRVPKIIKKLVIKISD